MNKYLYKYVKPKLICILENKSIRFTQSGSFNDPFEVFPSYESFFPKGKEKDVAELINYWMANNSEDFRAAVEKALQSFGLNLPTTETAGFLDLVRGELASDMEGHLMKYSTKVTPQLKKDIMNNIRIKMNEGFGILSLSEVKDSILMWSHYTDCHRGFIVKFKSDHEFFDQTVSDKDIIRKMKKVIYSSKRPKFHSMNPDWFEKGFGEYLASIFFHTKCSDWGYEAEWRMVMPLSKASSVKHINDEKIYLFDLPADCIEGIILGVNADQKLKEKVYSLVQQTDFHHLSIEQAELDLDRYKILIKK